MRFGWMIALLVLLPGLPGRCPVLVAVVGAAAWSGARGGPPADRGDTPEASAAGPGAGRREGGGGVPGCGGTRGGAGGGGAGGSLKEAEISASNSASTHC